MTLDNMRRTRLALAAISLLGLLAACGGAEPAVAEVDAPASGAQALVQMSAHRGGPNQWPENTLVAFEKAIGLGVEILEFDMNLTADDQVVLHHDTQVNPEICQPDPAAPVGHGHLRDLTLAQAQSFDCGSQHAAQFPTQQAVPGARMPSLDEFLEAVKASDTVLFGETKMPRTEGAPEIDPELFVARINDRVRAHGLEERFILQSGDYRTIDAMHRINPRIRTCLLRMGEAKPDFLGMARRHNASCVVMRLDYGDAGDIRTLKDAGVLVYSDVADTREQWDAYLELGVDAILTNDPVALREHMQSKGLRR